MHSAHTTFVDTPLPQHLLLSGQTWWGPHAWRDPSGNTVNDIYDLPQAQQSEVKGGCQPDSCCALGAYVYTYNIYCASGAYCDLLCLRCLWWCVVLRTRWVQTSDPRDWVPWVQVCSLNLLHAFILTLIRLLDCAEDPP